MNGISLIIFYLFLFIYLAGSYCYYQMTTPPSILLSSLIFFSTVILALIGKYFTLLLSAYCETINICISARNNYCSTISSFNFRLNLYYFCIKFMYLIFFLLFFLIVNNDFKALEGKCSNQTRSMSIF
jgi:hypothetical protein